MVEIMCQKYYSHLQRKRNFKQQIFNILNCGWLHRMLNTIKFYCGHQVLIPVDDNYLSNVQIDITRSEVIKRQTDSTND